MMDTEEEEEEKEEKMEVEEAEMEENEEKMMDVVEEENTMEVEETSGEKNTDGSVDVVHIEANNAQESEEENSEEDPFSPLSSSQLRKILAGMVQTPNREPGRQPVKRKLEFRSPNSIPKKLVLNNNNNNNFSDIKPIIIAPEGCAENPILILNSDEGNAKKSHIGGKWIGRY